MKSFYLKLLSILIISVLGILVYSNTFDASFHFDDVPSIVENYFIRDIHHLQAIWNFLPRRFFLYLSIAINYHFNGLDVFGYHVFNLGVHLVTAILVWYLTLLTLSTPALKVDKIAREANLIALFAGLIFAAHPVQTQAVTYIVQRAASMATLFYLASLILYIKSRLLQANKSNSAVRTVFYCTSLLMAVIAMFTKEIAITLPLMILLYEFSFLRTKKDFHWKLVLPFLLTVLIIPLTIYFTESVKAQQMRGIVPDGPAGISPLYYLFTQSRVMITYIRLVFLPIHQNLDYDYPVFKSIFELPVLCSVIFLTAILFIVKHFFSKYRLPAFAILWFFLTLLPESSIFPIRDVIYEHRLYLPLVGYSIFLASGAYYLSAKKRLKGMVVVLTLLVAVYSLLTYQRNKVWKNEITLWDDVVSKSPHKARPQYNRGRAYTKEGDFTRALPDFNKAISINPDYAEAYNNRGLIYGSQGDTTQAMADFNKAIELKPDLAMAYINRGNVYGIEGDMGRAMIDFNKAIAISPVYSEAYNNRGHIYINEGDFTQAVEDFTKAIEIDPKNIDAYKNRAVGYYALNEYDRAWADVDRAEELGASLNPDFINDLKKASR